MTLALAAKTAALRHKVPAAPNRYALLSTPLGEQLLDAGTRQSHRHGNVAGSHTRFPSSDNACLDWRRSSSSFLFEASTLHGNAFAKFLPLIEELPQRFLDLVEAHLERVKLNTHSEFRRHDTTQRCRREKLCGAARFAYSFGFANLVLNTSDLIIVGLFFDVAGGFVLATGFMMKTPEEAADEAATRSGQNIALFRSAIFQRAEAWCGATLLGVGFLLQLIGTIQRTAQTGFGLLDSPMKVVMAGLLTCFLARLWLLAFRFDAQARFLEHVFSAVPPERDDDEVPSASAVRMARLWCVSVTPGETSEQLAVRLTALRREFILRYRDAARIHGMRSAAQMIGGQVSRPGTIVAGEVGAFASRQAARSISATVPLDGTIVSLVALTVISAGALPLLTKAFVPHVNETFLSANPFAVKREAIEGVMAFLFGGLTAVGALVQGIGMVVGVSDRRYSRWLYACVLGLSILAMTGVVVGTRSVGYAMARYEWWPVAVEGQRDLFRITEQMVANDGLEPAHVKQLRPDDPQIPALKLNGQGRILKALQQMEELFDFSPPLGMTPRERLDRLRPVFGGR